MHNGRFAWLSPKAPFAILFHNAIISYHPEVVAEHGLFAGNHLLNHTFSLAQSPYFAIS
jgi:hypothetical protein